MNVTLKPFDFAQAVARAGLGTDGVPLAKGPAAAPEVGFQKRAVNRSVPLRDDIPDGPSHAIDRHRSESHWIRES